MTDRDLDQGEGPNYGHILRDISENTRNLVRSEISLVRAEMKTVLPRVAKHSSQMLIFGTVCALSVFPFLAFLVIGLGRLLGDNYWLSSLIVAITFAAVGAPVALGALKKIKSEDLNFTRTKQGVAQSVHSIQDKVKEVLEAAKGKANHGYHH